MPNKTSPAQVRAVRRYEHRHKRLAKIYRWRTAFRELIRVASKDELQEIIKEATDKLHS